MPRLLRGNPNDVASQPHTVQNAPSADHEQQSEIQSAAVTGENIFTPSGNPDWKFKDNAALSLLLGLAWISNFQQGQCCIDPEFLISI